jgi:glycosyltransferase involved in cell wall biosynthesis
MRSHSPPHLVVVSDSQLWGGAEVVLGHLLAELDPAVRVTVVGTDAAVVGRLAGARPSAGAVVVPRVMSRSDVRAALLVWRELRRLRPDIIQVNLPSPASARQLLLIATTLPGTRVVAVEHLPAPLHTPAARRLKRLTSRRLAAHVAVGQQTAADVERIVGLRQGSVRVVPNGVPATSTTATYRPGRATLIGTVGRLEPRKGVDVLLTALHRLPGARLHVVGTGPLATEVAGLARELGVGDRCELIGWSEEVDRVLAEWDIFVLASRAEGMSLAVLQAMHVGLPVVVTDVGSVRELVVDGKTGLVVPPDDPAALTAALERLLADADLREQLGRAARRRAQADFGAATMARRYEGIYAELLGTAAAVPR